MMDKKFSNLIAQISQLILTQPLVYFEENPNYILTIWSLFSGVQNANADQGVKKVSITNFLPTLQEIPTS